MEFFVHDMKNLPVVVDKRLAELRRMDAHFNALSKKAAAEEAKLLDEVTALAKTNPDFDEEPVLEKFNAIMRCRQEAQVAADEQVKKIQKLYDLLDGRITFIGKNSGSLMQRHISTMRFTQILARRTSVICCHRVHLRYDLVIRSLQNTQSTSL